MMIEDDLRGTLNSREPHPMSFHALDFVKEKLTYETVEALSSCAISGNRLAEVCMGTVRRLRAGAAVSDRYILGLYAYLVRTEELEEGTNQDEIRKSDLPK